MLFEKIIVFEKSLIDTYIYILLIYFNLAEMKSDPKDDIFQTWLTQ